MLSQTYIKGNTKFFALALTGGGGPVGIFDLSKPGRMDPTVPVIAGHKVFVVCVCVRARFFSVVSRSSG